MAAISLEVARKHLNAWLEAELAVVSGQSYQIGTRKLERANLYQIREEIKFWKKEVARLEAQEKRKGARRVMRIVPRDL